MIPPPPSLHSPSPPLGLFLPPSLYLLLSSHSPSPFPSVSLLLGRLPFPRSIFFATSLCAFFPLSPLSISVNISSHILANQKKSHDFQTLALARDRVESSLREAVKRMCLQHKDLCKREKEAWRNQETLREELEEQIIDAKAEADWKVRYLITCIVVLVQYGVCHYFVCRNHLKSFILNN